MPRTKTTKAPKKSTKGGKYKLTLLLNGEKHELSGDSLGEMLGSFSFPRAIKSRFVVKAETKEKTVEEVVNALVARRLFGNHISVQLLAHNLTKKLG